MKRWGPHRTILAASALAVFVLAAALGWLLSRPQYDICDTDRSTDPQKIHATRVIVQPWLGQHQVFGIFAVPRHYQSSRGYVGTISVKSFQYEIIPERHLIQRYEDVVVEPGYYLAQLYVPTRIALWFLVTDQFAELRSRCNWTLEFRERSK